MACNDCVHYSFRTDECRRHAPLAYGKNGEARWPKLTLHDRYEWCGEAEGDEQLFRDKLIVRDPMKYAGQAPRFDTEEGRAQWLQRQVDEAKERIAEWEDK